MNLLIEDAQQKKGLPWKIILLSALLLVILFLGLLYFYIQSFKYIPTQEEQVPTPEVFKLEGTLFMTLAGTDPATGVREVYPAVADVANTQGVRLDIDTIKSEPVSTGHYNFSNDFEFATFLGLPLTERTLERGSFNSLNVYRAQIRGDKQPAAIRNAIEAVAEGFEGDQEDYYREAPVISELGDILYFSLPESTYNTASSSLATLKAEDWDVYLLSRDNRKVKLAEGIRPQWISPTQFAYLKNDGVFVYNILNNTQVQIWQSASALSIVDGLDVSDEGDKFVITTPSISEVNIVTVSDWEKGLIEIPATVSVAATNPLFSPDGEILALLMTYKLPDSEAITTEIRYYAIQRAAYLPETYPVDRTSITSIYLTDWQQ